MSKLAVANIIFETTESNRIEYTGNNVVRVRANGGLQIPFGTTAQRVSPEYGLIRYNTDTGTVEMYDAGGWFNTPTGGYVNNIYTVANSAYAAANNVGPQIAPAFNQANLAYTSSNVVYAAVNSAFGSINSNWTVTNTVYGVANAAFASANNVAPQIAPAYNTANAAFTTANTKFSSSGGTISGAVEITADLTVHGNTRFVDQQTLQVGDPLIYLAANNYASDVVDIGFVANYVNATGSNVHTGLYRSSGSKEYYLFYGYDKEPYNNYIDPTGNNITMAVLNSTFRTSNLILGGANTINWITSAYASINSNWTVGNTAYTVANLAYGVANTALQNTSGVWAAGTFNITNVGSFGYYDSTPTISTEAGFLGSDKDFRVKTTAGNTYHLLVKATTGNVGIGTASPSVSLDVGSKTDAIRVPVGTTAQRPSNPVTGYIRYNSTTGYFETYTSSGWSSISTAPVITSVSPSTYSGEMGYSFAINGLFFDSSTTVKFITAQGVEYSAAQVTYSNSNFLSATTPQDFTVANEPLSVKVTNGAGLIYTLSQAIDCGSTPTWSTASGTLATYYYPTDASYTVTVLATDPDSNTGGNVQSYSLSTGSLPSGASLNTSNGAITGAIANPGASSVTNSFDIIATDNAGNQSSSRTFNIIRKWADGSTQAAAGTSASAIKSLTGTTSDGTYWLNPTGTPFQTYCIMSRDGGGWAKVLQFYNATSMATTAAVNSGGTWINAEINLAAGKIPTADWTALNTTNSFLMRVTQTSGVGSHRYWRYRAGAAINNHHPRCARIMLYDAMNNYYNAVVFTGDNCSDSGTIPTDGQTWSYDFGGPAQVRGVACYVSYAGARNAYCYLDWSDDNVNWTNAGSGQMNAGGCGIVAWSVVSYTPADSLFYAGAGTAKLAYSGSLPAFGTDLDPTSNYTLYLDRANDGTYEYSATYTNDTRGRCNHTTNYWISDHNYNGTYSGTPPIQSGTIAQCWTIGTDRVITNLHWMSGQVTPSGGNSSWGDTSTSAFSIFVK